MPIIETPIPDLYVFEPKIWPDSRGYFYESYNEQTFIEAGITNRFVQDNQARSTRGVLRGLHYQVGEMAQAKLVRVILGEVLDVVVDIRPNSPTYGQSFCIRLSDENHLQLMVPRGFAHGYVVLSDEAIFCYKCDNFYSRAHEGGLMYNDPGLKIDWLIPADELSLSEKDLLHPAFGQHRPFE